MSPPSSVRSSCSVSEVAPFREDELSLLEEFERMNRRLTRHPSAKEETKQKNINSKKNSVPQKKRISRRRKIDPTTSTRHYTTEEVEFMNALNDYKRSSGRMFPTCCEILEVLKNLGYEKTMTGIAG